MQWISRWLEPGEDADIEALEGQCFHWRRHLRSTQTILRLEA